MASWKKIVTQDSNGVVSVSSKLGVGTSSPSTSLEISGGASKSLLVNSSSGTSTISAQKDGNYAQIGADGTSGFIKYGHTTTSTARNLRFFEGSGSEVMRLDSSGRLMIGTTTASGTLTVDPDENSSITLGKAKFYSAVSDYMYLSHFDYATMSNYAVKQAPTGSTTINAPSGQTVGLGINNSNKLTVSATGKVGIGTSSPGQTLHVDGNIRVGDSADYIFSNIFAGLSPALVQIQSSPSYDIAFNAGGAETVRFTSDGKVGIGTNNPSQIFHVKDSANTGTPDLFSVRSTGSEVRIGIGKGSADCALDFSTALPNGGGTIQNVFRMNLINNVRTGSHNGRLVLQSNNGIRIAGYNDNPSGNAYGLEVKNTRDGTDDKVLNIMKYDSTSLMTVKSNGLTGIGTDSPTQKLTISGGSVEIDEGDFYRVTSAGYGIGYSNYQTLIKGYNGMKVQGWISGLTDLFIVDTNSRISLSNNDAGGANTIFGYLAGDSIELGGSSNTAFGYTALQSNTTGDSNIALGYRALRDNTTSTGNVAVGSEALLNHISGNGGNIGIGAGALAVGTGGKQRNNAIGYRSQYLNETGIGNVSNGYLSLYYNLNGDYNIAIGYDSMKGSSSTTNVFNNVAIGYQSLLSLTNGSNNVAVGYGAGSAMTNNANNVIVGRGAFQTADNGENNNTIIGDYAGRYINNDNADHNVLIGNASGQGGTGELKQCVVIGSLAMDATGTNAQTGAIAIGYTALSDLTSGTGNLAIGYENSRAITTGSQNVSLGGQSLRHNETGSNNTAIGAQAMLGVSGNSHSNNTAVGYQSLYSITTGSDNVAIGHQAGNAVTTGTNNIFIGNSNPGSTTMTNHTILGTPDTDRTSIFGRVSLHSVSSNYATFSHYDARTSGVGYALRQSEAGATNLNSASGQRINFSVNNDTKAVLSGDNFGIGTTSPLYKLDLTNGMRINRSSNDPYILFARSSTSVAQIRGVNGGGINITDGGSSNSRIYVDSSGNVGIGDTTPTTLLDVGGSFQVQGTADFQDTVVFEGDVDLTNASIEGLPTPTASPTTIFKCATTATNINFGVSLTKGDILFGIPSTENGTYISHTDNDEQIILKRAGEYEISVTLVVTAQSASNRFTCLTYVEHYSSSNTLLDSYGLEAMYIRSNGGNYNSGAMAGQIRIITSSLNTWVKVTSMVLDRESTGTVPLNTTYSKIRIDKIEYNQ